MIFTSICLERLDLTLNSFNFLFFFLLLLLTWIFKRKWHGPLFFGAGLLFVFHYSPLCAYLLIPSFLLISYRSLVPVFNGKTMVEASLWMMSWVLFFYFLTIEDFRHYHFTKMFPFEILLLGFYNLGRGYILFHEVWIRKRKYGFLEALGYFWHPPLLFSGPLETLEEWSRYYRCTKPSIQWTAGFKLLGSSILLGFIGETLYTYATPSDLDFKTTSYLRVLLYGWSVGMVIHFRVASYIHFTRSFSIFMGYPFQKPNFYHPYQSRSVTSFWSRWNMSVVRFAREYFFFRNFASFSRNKFLLSILLYFLLLGIFHGLDVQYGLWGVAQGLGIIAGFLYLFARYKSPALLIWDRKWFPVWLKRCLTLLYLHLSWVLVDPNWDQVLGILFGCR